MSGFQSQGSGRGRSGSGDYRGGSARGASSGGRDGGRGGGGGRGDGGGGRGGPGEGREGRESYRGGGGRDGPSRADGRGGSGRGDFGGGPGRGGGAGANPHLGTTHVVLSFRDRTPGMTDSDILAVINPRPADRDRTGLIDAGGYSPVLPAQNVYRQQTPIGVPIGHDNRLVITTNHFVVTGDAPTAVTQYAVHLYRIGSNGADRSPDVAGEEDVRKTVQVMKSLLDRHTRDWGPVAYDTRSTLFTTSPLRLSARNAEGLPYLSEIVGLPNKDGSESTVLRYRVTLTEAASNLTGMALLRALETSLLMYGRWQMVQDTPQWVTTAQCIYPGSDALTAGVIKPYTQGFEHLLVKQGWYASIKQCSMGKMLIVDLAISCFLASGDLPELMYKAAGYRDLDSFYNTCKSPRGLHPMELSKIDKAIAKTKVKVTHLGFWKVIRHLGPAANHADTRFKHEGEMYTVDAYFTRKACTDGRYKKLRYPYLPTVNMGSALKKELYPAELVTIPPGQVRNKMITENPRLASEVIKYAAVKPSERMAHIVDSAQSVVKVLKRDVTAQVFGLDSVSVAPQTVQARVLPQAKLQYGPKAVVDPQFAGTWAADYPRTYQFVKAPANPVGGSYMYRVLIVGAREPVNVLGFCTELERVAAAAGLPLRQGGAPLPSPADVGPLKEQFIKMKADEVRIVLVVMVAETAYGTIKLVSDTMALPTQCIKYSKLEKSPRGIHYNLVIKMNNKLGGTNHTLKSRLPATTTVPVGSTFQSPPASLSWIFDKPCMLVGIDVSHPEPGSDKPSMAAVVGTVDGTATKYVAHMSSQGNRVEMVSALTAAMGCLFASFRERNMGKMPATVLVYRDGVSEPQYDQVLQQELPQIQGAIAQQGFFEGIKVAIVICTKGHRTRIVGQEGVGGAYVNPCPGLVVDSAITSASLNEFYLNSHAAIQGTAKPCRYTLIYDEVGFKMSELELLTYWTTYLYGRCNKSVSYATPAYYAHWASKRGKELLAAGATAGNLGEISQACAQADAGYNMFFI